ncbi:hypothetical protein K493DRAFT_406416 [Basidiobolus meristosporus CBS 931.73]|uniref:Ribosomal RNA-processing protein 43 n=1 Tax=Basidiobolus meristosporus CBS 931.73 TaxID=1314790 RepID=A0A1Y1YME4_9FUNG|nr:hypothetical protein K493DRAFT_406416 [Basidiobolus meristosporus CBS 931.73]|eukprot:ORX99013.1 hypothetical protein K493DRAFT_406416 [Basidiobolus meristosporus CBS 931.73]
MQIDNEPTGFTFSGDTFRKIHPAEYYRKFLSQNIRPDGRSLSGYRQTKVTPGAISTADGSALVRIGDTSVLCGIKAEVAEPKIATPNEGFVVPNVELPPLCSSQFKPGPPSEKAQVLSENINNLLHSCKIMSLDQLCIEEGKAVWVLYVDIVCLNYDGNIFDAALIAFIAALKNVKLPKVAYSSDEGMVTATREEETQLKLDHILYPATFGLFDGERVIADPNHTEESLVDTLVTITLDESNKLSAIWKDGGVPCSKEQMQEFIEAAKVRAQKVQEILDQQ